MIILYILIICLGVYMFGPLLVSAVGAFFSGVIFVAFLVLTAPLIHLVARKDMKESDRLYDQIQAAKEKGDIYKSLVLEEKLAESENRVADKIRAVCIFMIIILAVLIVFAIVG